MKVPGGVLNATAAPATLEFNADHIFISNEGAKTVYLSLQQHQDSGEEVSVSDFYLKTGEYMLLDGHKFARLRYVCGGADATTLRFIAWK